MGLDQYAYFVKKSQVRDNFSFDGEHESDVYWRKNRHLQGFMEQLFHDKGGEDEFNCCFIRLEKDDLDKLEERITKRDFEDVHGFFWGDYDYTDDDAEYDMQFVHDAKDHIDSGGAVYYSSWW